MLEGKIALVTGAAGDQGIAVALRYRREGAHVVAADVAFPADRREMLEKAGCVSLVEVDVSLPSAISTVRDALERLGRCDILYNNAGVFLAGRGDGPAGEIGPDAWATTIGVNLNGAFHVVAAVLPFMIGQANGVIINVASLAGVVGSRHAAYTASKAGVIGLTKSIAFTHGRDGVRAIALSLGVVNTQMLDHAREDPDRWEQILSSVPLGRAAEPEEIAGWASFLASNAASYANGANFVIDGGRGVGI